MALVESEPITVEELWRVGRVRDGCLNWDKCDVEEEVSLTDSVSIPALSAGCLVC